MPLIDVFRVLVAPVPYLCPGVMHASLTGHAPTPRGSRRVAGRGHRRPTPPAGVDSGAGVGLGDGVGRVDGSRLAACT